MSIDTPLIGPTTELEAINSMLRTIGESPLDTLDEVFADSAVCQQLLREELRAICNAEWTFNTELGEALQPDGDGNINLPSNTLRVICDPTIVQRGLRLYDRVNRTYAFPAAVTLDRVIVLPFDELPEAARRFIFIRAGRRFMDDVQSDGQSHGFKAKDELAAWTALLNYEAQVAQWNVLDRLALNLRTKRFRFYGSGGVGNNFTGNGYHLRDN